MADNLQKTIDRLAAKAQLLVDRHNALSKAYATATEKIDELEATNRTQRGRIEALEQENMYLKMASTLKATPADKEETRRLLTKLLRDIDQCINDLNH
ncbi:MAG: hypothetical protein LUC85_00100 [Bacteroidales bacterium]|nr:hypothetical protein [Bacteroidales bacterium]MCD8393220.1 hypothetical protein [Bacteroidales bacterium]